MMTYGTSTNIRPTHHVATTVRQCGASSSYWLYRSLQYLNTSSTVAARVRDLNPYDDVVVRNSFPHGCPFIRGIHRLHVDIPYNGSVVRNFDVFYVSLSYWVVSRVSDGLGSSDVPVVPVCWVINKPAVFLKPARWRYGMETLSALPTFCEEVWWCFLWR